MSSHFQLSKDQIIAALVALNGKLHDMEVTGELCIFGGAAMVLAFDARQSTRDVDAIFRPKQDVMNAIVEVAADLGLPHDWLNDGVKGFVSGEGELTEDDLPQFSHLRILRPVASYLLAMKCMAARSGAFEMSKDAGDALVLCRHLGLKTEDEILNLVCHYFPAASVQVRTQLFITVLVEDLKHSPS
jgi:hypothetical protein